MELLPPAAQCFEAGLEIRGALVSNASLCPATHVMDAMLSHARALCLHTATKSVYFRTARKQHLVTLQLCK